MCNQKHLHIRLGEEKQTVYSCLSCATAECQMCQIHLAVLKPNKEAQPGRFVKPIITVNVSVDPVHMKTNFQPMLGQEPNKSTISNIFRCLVTSSNDVKMIKNAFCVDRWEWEQMSKE